MPQWKSVDTKIVINCAMSADGKIALPDRSQIRLSNKEDMERVNKLRKKSFSQKQKLVLLVVRYSQLV